MGGRPNSYEFGYVVWLLGNRIVWMSLGVSVRRVPRALAEAARYVVRRFSEHFGLSWLASFRTAKFLRIRLRGVAIGEIVLFG